VEHEKSLKSRSSALNPRTALTKILMLIGKFQAFRITCIMLILGFINNLDFYALIKKMNVLKKEKD